MTNKTENNNLISSSSVEDGGEQTTNNDPNFDRKLDLVTAGARPYIKTTY
jgi:hypothetical protein